MYNDEDYMLTPCRFTPSGWKYVRKDTVQKLLNHPNKINSVGYYSNARTNFKSGIINAGSSTIDDSTININDMFNSRDDSKYHLEMKR